MRTFDLSLATVVLGALAVSYSACSAQGQDNSVPGGTPSGHSSGSGNSSSAGSTSSAGAPPVTGAAGSVVHPSAGAPPAAAGGSFNTGVGGATTNFAGRPGTAGAATGAAGAATSGGCQVKAGVAAEVLIDDLEDNDNVIQPIGNRTGYWYTFNDGTPGAVQVPDPATLFKPAAGGTTATPKYAATTSGPAFTSYGAGMGFDFNNTASKACPYDATAYSGITFYAKANTGNMTGMTLKVMLKIPATTPVAQASGACAAASKCEDHYALKPAPVLTTAWTKYTITFASKATFDQQGFGAAATFDKSKIIAMQFQVAQDVKFNFSIDDIAFF